SGAHRCARARGRRSRRRAGRAARARARGRGLGALRGRRARRSRGRRARRRGGGRGGVVPRGSGGRPARMGRLLGGVSADTYVSLRVRRLVSDRKTQILLNGGLGVGLLAVAFFSARHFVHTGWPLSHADPLLVGLAGLFYLVAYPFKAW